MALAESDWEKSIDVEGMLHSLWEHHPELKWTDRRLKRLSLACVQAVRPHVAQKTRDLIDLLEIDVDQPVKQQRIEEAAAMAEASDPKAAGLIFAVGSNDLGLAVYEAAKIISGSIEDERGRSFDQVYESEAARVAACIRNIFGNPFRESGPPV